MGARIYRRAIVHADDPRDDVTSAHTVDPHFEQLVLHRRQQVDVALSAGECACALDATNADREPLRLMAAAPFCGRVAFHDGWRQRDGNPRNPQATADGLDAHSIAADGDEVSRDSDRSGGGRASAGRYRCPSDQRLERGRENDVVALKQGGAVGDGYAETAGKDGQRIVNQR